MTGFYVNARFGIHKFHSPASCSPGNLFDVARWDRIEWIGSGEMRFSKD